MLPDSTGTARFVAVMVTNLIAALPEGCYHRSHVTMRLFGRDVTFVAHPDYVRAVLQDDESFGHSDVMQRALEPMLGSGILTSEGVRWQHQRRAATPAFRHESVLSLLPAINQAAEAAADRWLAAGTVDVAAEMMRATLEVIAAALLPDTAGLDPSRFARGLTAYLEQSGWHVGLDLFRLPPWFPYPGRYSGARAARDLRALMRGVVRAAPSQSDGGLLKLLRASGAPEGGGFTEDELVDNVLTYIAAGHETTASTMTWALWLLACHPEAAAAVAAEGAAIAGPIGEADIARLPFTRRVVQETMRLYPAAPILVREVRRDTAVVDARFPVGAAMYLPIIALHRHRSAWPDPERFDPDRFLPEQTRERHRFAYLPFGAGPRVCVGATLALTETTVMLALLLRRLALLPPTGPAPRPIMRVTLRAGGGVRLASRPRSRARPACARPAAPAGSAVAD